MLTYDFEYQDVNDQGELETYTARSIAAIFDTNADGSFDITLAKPRQNSKISAVAVNAAGGISGKRSTAVEGYEEDDEQPAEPVESFASIGAAQVSGKNDVTVSLLGTENIGMNVSGDVLYRVVDTQPTAQYTAGDNFDTTGWISVGAVTSFIVKNVSNGQYIEVVQIAKDNVYSLDDQNNPVITGVKNKALRYGSVAISIKDIPTYTVSGNLIIDATHADFTDVTLKLTHSADSSIEYTTTVEIIADTFSYTFNSVISGTYILSLEDTSGKVSADKVIVTVDSSDTQKDLQVISRPYIPGDINDDGKVNNKDLTRLFQYLSDWDVEVNEAALDVNGDGKVNNKDLTRLFQYLSDWDVQIF